MCGSFGWKNCQANQMSQTILVISKIFQQPARFREVATLRGRAFPELVLRPFECSSCRSGGRNSRSCRTLESAATRTEPCPKIHPTSILLGGTSAKDRATSHETTGAADAVATPPAAESAADQSGLVYSVRRCAAVPPSARPLASPRARPPFCLPRPRSFALSPPSALPLSLA